MFLVELDGFDAFLYYLVTGPCQYATPISVIDKHRRQTSTAYYSIIVRYFVNKIHIHTHIQNAHLLNTDVLLQIVKSNFFVKKDQMLK